MHVALRLDSRRHRFAPHAAVELTASVFEQRELVDFE